jgi:hypothetical protein
MAPLADGHRLGAGTPLRGSAAGEERADERERDRKSYRKNRSPHAAGCSSGVAPPLVVEAASVLAAA